MTTVPTATVRDQLAERGLLARWRLGRESVASWLASNLTPDQAKAMLLRALDAGGPDRGCAVASSVSMGVAWPLNGATYNESDLAPIDTAHLAAGATGSQVMSGVLPGGGALDVTAGSGMTVTVGTGSCAIANSSGSTYGGFLATATSATTLTVSGSDLVNPRVDLICATVNDLGTSSADWVLQIITGTPTGGATLASLDGAPDLPDDSLLLAYLLVPALSSSVSSGNISDQRVFTACQGGIIPVPNLDSGVAALTPYQGTYVHDRQTLRLARLSVSDGVLQPTLLPFAPPTSMRPVRTHLEMRRVAPWWKATRRAGPAQRDACLRPAGDQARAL
jgi:hypothetical protein